MQQKMLVLAYTKYLYTLLINYHDIIIIHNYYGQDYHNKKCVVSCLVTCYNLPYGRLST